MKRNTISKKLVIFTVATVLLLGSVPLMVSAENKDTLCNDITGKADAPIKGGSKSDIFYAYNAYDTAMDEGPISFPSDDPGDVTLLAASGMTSFLTGACFVEDLWYACEYYDGATYPDDTIWIIDTTDGSMTEVGDYGLSESLNGLAYDDSTETLYGCSGTNLYTIDTVTGSATLVGSMGTSGLFVGIASDGQGTLYGVDIGDESLYSINPTTAVATLIGDTGIGNLNYAQDMAFDKNNDILYIAAYTETNNGELYSCDVTDATSTLIGAFGVLEVTAFAIPYDFYTPEHDISVTDIDVPDTVPHGDTQTVSAVVNNIGNNTETSVVVDFKVDSTVIDSTTITSIDPEESIAVSFSWDPTVGTYFVEIESQPIPDEEDTENNAVNNTVDVVYAPDIDVSPTVLTFMIPADDTDSKTLTITNLPIAEASLDYSITVDDGGSGWLSAAPLSGTIAIDDYDDITVSVDSTGLAEGSYIGELVIDNNDLNNPQITVPVNLFVVYGDDMASMSINYPTGTIYDVAHVANATIQNLGSNPQTDVLINCSIFEGGIGGEIYSTDFSTDPTDWTITNVEGTAWTWDSTEERMENTYSGSPSGYLDSPAIDCSGKAGVTLSFWHYWKADYSSGNQDGYVRGSIDGGTTWPYLIDEFHHNDPAEEDAVKNYDISSWADGQSQVMIRYDITNDNDWYWYIDDFYLNASVSGDLVYSSETTVSFAAYEQKYVEFSPAWDADIGVYGIQVSTHLTGDENTGNDVVSEEVIVEELPTPVLNIDTGEGFFTIQEAIDDDDTLDGHTIEVTAGSYSEDAYYGIYVWKELTLLGPNDGVCGTDSRNPEAVLHYPTGLIGTGADWACVLYIDADNVTIDGFTINEDGYDTCTGYAYFTGIYAEDSNNTVISNNIMDGFNYISMLLSGGGGYPATIPTSGAYVNCNYVKNNFGLYHSLYLQGIGGTVTGNTVDDCSAGIQIQPYSQPIGGTVIGNDFKGTVNGIYYNYANKGAGKWFIEENNIAPADPSKGLWTGTAEGNHFELTPIVTKDYKSGINWTGLHLRTHGNSGTGDVPDVEFNYNTVDGLGVTDPYWDEIRAVQIQNIHQTSLGLFYGNTFANSDVGVYVFDNANVDNIAFHQNNFIGNTDGIENINSYELDATCNWWDDITGPTHASNPTGAGESVTDNVDFEPWLTDAYPEGDCLGFIGPVHNLDTGEDFTTIQAAIDDSDTLNGHTIIISPGTFTEDVSVYKSVTLIGYGNDLTIVESATKGPVWTISADDVTIQDLTITDSSELGEGIRVVSPAASGLTVDNVAFTQLGAGTGANAYGIYIATSFSDLSVVDCNFVSAPHTTYYRTIGIFTPNHLNHYNFEVLDSTFTTIWTSIYLRSAIDGFIVSGNTFESVQFSDCSACVAGIYIGDGDNDNFDLENIEVYENIFTEYGRGVYIWNYGANSSIDTLNIHDNLFENSIWSAAIRVIAGIGYDEQIAFNGIVVDNNDFTQDSDIGAHVGMIDFRTYCSLSACDLTITNNDIALTGAPYADPMSGIILNAYEGPFTNTIIENNVLDGGYTGGTDIPPSSGILIRHESTLYWPTEIMEIDIMGNDITCFDHGLSIYDADNLQYGGLPTGSIINVNENNLDGNALFGIRNDNGETIDATCNWWGDITGPTHASNPGGVGDEVTDYVTYLPWLTDEYPYGDCTGGLEQLDIEQTVQDRGFPIRHAVDGDWGAAQNFTPTLNHVSKVELYLRTFGTPEFDLTVELRQDGPQGTLLDTVTFTPAEVPSTWTWFEIDFEDQFVGVGSDVFVVIPPAPSGVTTSFGYEWGYAFGDQYPDGSFWFTRDGGGLWRDLPTMYEFVFKTYGF